MRGAAFTGTMVATSAAQLPDVTHDRDPAEQAAAGRAVRNPAGPGRGGHVPREAGASSPGGRIATVVTVTGGGRYRHPALTIAGSGVLLPLGFFDLKEIQRQCQADGWRFSGQGRRRLA